HPNVTLDATSLRRRAPSEFRRCYTSKGSPGLSGRTMHETSRSSSTTCWGDDDGISRCCRADVDKDLSPGVSYGGQPSSSRQPQWQDAVLGARAARLQDWPEPGISTLRCSLADSPAAAAGAGHRSK